MSENESRGNELFSRMIRAGRRTYFVSVKSAKNNLKYITLTESRLNGQNGFDRSRIMFFPEKLEELVDALQDAAEVLA
ncbi:MAG: DUF3276 family protein [Candidatus Margulisiibacteriota bacterium]